MLSSVDMKRLSAWNCASPYSQSSRPGRPRILVESSLLATLVMRFSSALTSRSVSEGLSEKQVSLMKTARPIGNNLVRLYLAWPMVEDEFELATSIRKKLNDPSCLVVNQGMLSKATKSAENFDDNFSRNPE